MIYICLAKRNKSSTEVKTEEKIAEDDEVDEDMFTISSETFQNKLEVKQEDFKLN